MSNANIPKQTEILAIRMNPQLLHQLNALATAKQMGTATMARMALIDYLKNEAPNALIGTPTPTKPLNKLEQQRLALSPAERAKQDADYAEAWG